ncbi:MAG: CPBP family intramembrane metalloprotease [Spirochaetales bacterium]|nr:CPBP family intramembrane metalloprotease [Spirochaetales bacterium]
MELFEIKKQHLGFNLLSLIPILLIVFGYDIVSSEINNIFVFFFKIENSNSFFDDNEISILSVIKLCIIPSVLEEWIFRFLFLTYLCRYLTVFKSILISSIVFSLFHSGVLRFIYALPIGILLAIIFVYSSSIVYCVLIHFFSNLWGFISSKIIHNINGYTRDNSVSFQIWYLDILGIVCLSLGLFFLFRIISKSTLRSRREV